VSALAGAPGVAWWWPIGSFGLDGGHMSGRDTKGSGLSVLDTALVAAAVIGGILVVLWLAHAVVGLILFAFKVAILAVVVFAVVRLLHLFTRTRD
jgi:hypothetical protein